MQRKNIAKVQIKKQFDKLSKENNIIKKKIIYSERLTSKFQKCFENHAQDCINGAESVSIIRDILLADAPNLGSDSFSPNSIHGS